MLPCVTLGRRPWDIILCYISYTDIFATGHKHKLLINKGELSAGEGCEDEYHTNDGSEWNRYERYSQILASILSSHMEVIAVDKIYPVSGDVVKRADHEVIGKPVVEQFGAVVIIIFWGSNDIEKNLQNNLYIFKTITTMYHTYTYHIMEINTTFVSSCEWH